MEQEHGSNDRILKNLRFHPKGMTITEISKQTHLTRNSVSKHLEVLRIGGHVDMRVVGNAKVYSLAQRVPMSAFLCFTRNLIVVLDRYGTIVQINEQFLNFAGLKKDEIVGENIRDVSIPIVSEAKMIALIESVEKEQFATDVRYTHNNVDFFYQMQVIPTVFEDGGQGHTIVLEDITDKRRYMWNMEFLARTAMEFVAIPKETDIYQRIAELILEFVPEGQVFVSSYDETRQKYVIRAVMDQDFRDSLIAISGRDIVGMEISLDEVFSSPFFENYGEMKSGIREIYLSEKSADGSLSFYDFAFQQIPEKICEEIAVTWNIGKAYMAFLTWNEELFGDVGILLSADGKIDSTKALDSFIRLASIAISKRMTEEQLRRSNRRFREVVEYSPFPAAIIDSDGRYTFINQKFTEIFGYTLADIPTGRKWFEKAFPDPEMRKKVIKTWEADLKNAGVSQVRPRTFPVMCKNGEMKIIQFWPVQLCENVQYITYEDISELRQVHQIILSEIAELMDVREDLWIRNQALASLETAIAIVDMNGLLKYVNPAFVSLWGYDSPEEVRGTFISDFLGSGAAAMDFVPMLDQNEQWSGLMTGFRKNKSPFTVQVHVTGIADTEGQVVGLMVSFSGEVLLT
ncbi:PAS domain-containing protein [Methanogenium marinum]|uniref:PAS domain-containing protein n=1 Tax=Methanogenium marinum TaxID=348610 RepID=A0A9Q4KT28_9EURY|nr:PAS domain-containing protein [Methanogenium marinum]MDE4907688.1 PAS domain-containing protein [Methanogenium marinum]